MTHVRIVATLFLVLTAPVVAAQQLDQFERILLPIEPVFYLPGSDRSYGAAVSYASGHPIRYYPASDLLGKPLGIGELTPSHGENLRITTTFPTNGAGRFLFVEKGAADDMELTLNLHTDDDTYGALTTVPVVESLNSAPAN